MAVRNFWITAENDRNGKPLATGPRGKDEGMDIRLQQRKNGAIIDALRVRCWARSDGTLQTVVTTADNTEVFTFTTER